jgi:hypothetical protein
MMSIDSYRRLTGLVFGGVLGLAYGLVSQTINRAVMPGLPLYQPPLGPLGNTALGVAGGALLGVVAAWGEDSVVSTMLASAASAALIVGGSLLQARPTGNQLAAVVVNLVFLVLPFWGMLVPIIAALRWGVNKLVEGHRDRTRIGSRLRVPIALVLVVGLVGATSLYRAEARLLLTRTDALLRENQQAAVTDALAAPLAGPDAGPFIERGKGPYTLAWELRGIEKYRIPRPGKNFDSHSVVVARFKNGWNLVCLYVAVGETPLCKGFEELPR